MRLIRSSVLLVSIILPTLTVCAQVDDVSDVVGLPIPIGAPVIYGQVVIRNIPRNERRPIIFVHLRSAGAYVDKFQVTEKGYWYFLKNPSSGLTLVFEIDGVEFGQSVIAGGFSNRYRQDVEFDWNSLRGGSAKPSTRTVSARDRYDRPSSTQKDFDAGMEAVRENRNEDAVRIFSSITEKDPKDFVAWMMLGAVKFAEKKHEEARVAFAKAVELKPDYFLGNLNYGRLELAQKSFEKAITLLSKAVELEPRSADANQLLGEAYLQSKKGSMAVGYLNKALEIAPVEKADIHLRLAALYNNAGYKNLASAEYVKFLEKVKDHPDRKKFEQYIKDNPPK